MKAPRPDLGVGFFESNQREFPISLEEIVTGYGLFLEPVALKCHLRILFVAWSNMDKPVGSLEDDDARLAQAASVPIRTWKRIKSAALTGFELRDRQWTHPRLKATYERYVEAVTVQSGLRKSKRVLSAKVRFAILERDGFRCVYCGRAADQVTLEVDHIKPKALGGTDEPDNLRTACFDCNAGKSDRIILAAAPKEAQ